MTTRRFVLLGDPVAHSKSPAIHRAAFGATGVAGTYTARRTDAAGVGAACREIRDGSLEGANVTMPLKRVALEAVDRVTDTARRTAAVNTLYRVGDAVVGDNTDVGGVLDAWKRRRLPADVPVLVLGAGGAAAAAVVALEGRHLEVSSRRHETALRLLEQVGVQATVRRWGQALEGAVVVNATPLGMGGELLPPGLLGAATALFDMAYGPEPTPAVLEMRGRPVADGLDMLVAQAARSFTLWTGVSAPIEVMEAAARA